MDKMTEFETRLAGFAVTVEKFVEDVGKLPTEDDGNRIVSLSLLTAAAESVLYIAPWEMVREALEYKGLTNSDRKRFSVAYQRLDVLRKQFDGACKTLEESRKMWLDGLN